MQYTDSVPGGSFEWLRAPADVLSGRMAEREKRRSSVKRWREDCVIGGEGEVTRSRSAHPRLGMIMQDNVSHGSV